MFASPESRAKKEAKKSVATQEASAENQVGIANNKNVEKLNSLQGKSNNLVENSPLNSLQQKANKNNTGLPDNLKFGVESLSGISLDDVKVNYNSDKTSSLGAHGYAQGNQIHLEGGQEKHLAHEAWHVVQQKQGRVNSTKEVNGKRINDDSLLEKEATNMGNKANAFSSENIGNKLISSKPFKSSSNKVFAFPSKSVFNCSTLSPTFLAAIAKFSHFAIFIFFKNTISRISLINNWAFSSSCNCAALKAIEGG